MRVEKKGRERGIARRKHRISSCSLCESNKVDILNASASSNSCGLEIHYKIQLQDFHHNGGLSPTQVVVDVNFQTCVTTSSGEFKLRHFKQLSGSRENNNIPTATERLDI